MPYCDFCRTHEDRKMDGTWVCECSFCAGCDMRVHETELDDDNLCEKCRKEAYKTAHGCHHCASIYPGNLINLGLNAAKVETMACPSCSAADIQYECTLMEAATDPDDKEAHRLAALEVLGKLRGELRKDGYDE